MTYGSFDRVGDIVGAATVIDEKSFEYAILIEQRIAEALLKNG
jgi:hypothetical protein